MDVMVEKSPAIDDKRLQVGPVKNQSSDSKYLPEVKAMRGYGSTV